jgi:hypothetical protein
MTARTPEGPIPLVAVVGPVEPPLLREFVLHYRRLGIERLLIAFHFPEHVPASSTDELVAECRSLVGDPVVISTGPWHETTNLALRERLRRRAGNGWHLLADVDEFHAYPAPIPTAVATAEAVGVPFVEGVLLDRVSPDGSLRPWSEAAGLDRTYSIGGFLTHHLLRGDPRKVVLAHASVDVSVGNHRSPGRRGAGGTLVPVHHFKWRDGLVAYLQRRVTMFATGRWREVTPSMRNEAQRLIAHLRAHGGRIDVEDRSLGLRPVTLAGLPPRWEVESQQVMAEWRARYP